MVRQFLALALGGADCVFALPVPEVPSEDELPVCCCVVHPVLSVCCDMDSVCCELDLCDCLLPSVECDRVLLLVLLCLRGPNGVLCLGGLKLEIVDANESLSNTASVRFESGSNELLISMSYEWKREFD